MCTMEKNSFYICLWLSKVILKISAQPTKKLYRTVEKNALKIIANESHLIFNETCLIYIYYTYMRNLCLSVLPVMCLVFRGAYIECGIISFVGTTKGQTVSLIKIVICDPEKFGF